MYPERFHARRDCVDPAGVCLTGHRNQDVELHIVLKRILHITVMLLCFGCAPRLELDTVQEAGFPARTYPDYHGITIPPNIAPLNFRIDEPGTAYVVRVLSSGSREVFSVHSRDGVIRFPLNKWQRALEDNTGSFLHLGIYVRNETGEWMRYDVNALRISTHPIDEYLTYRRIHPGYTLPGMTTINERSLTCFSERVVFHSRQFGCMNCHTQSRYHASRMLLQVRDPLRGPSIVIKTDGEIRNVDARTEERPHTPAFSSWHPSGEFVAFSHNRIQQFFHTAGKEPREAVEYGGNLAVYRIKDGYVFSSTNIANPDFLENWPQWSHDGRYLYFSRTSVPWTTPPTVPSDGYAYWSDIKYDIVRSEFDQDAMGFGPVETVISSEEYGLSMSQVRPSPNGHWIVFVAHAHGSFFVFQASANLWLMDLSTGSIRELEEINSHQADTWPNWSTNSRWLVFSTNVRRVSLAGPILLMLMTMESHQNPSFYRSRIH